jgi:hypothetical protein
VFVEDISEPIIASRSESAILRDLTETPKEITRAREQYQLLTDIADTVAEINPVVRAIIRDQGNWDLNRLEERIKEILRDEERSEAAVIARWNSMQRIERPEKANQLPVSLASAGSLIAGGPDARA